MSTAGTDQRPILDRYAADPFILRTAEGWWLYASHGAQDGRRIPIYHSTDLESWTFVRGAVAPGPEPTSWNRRNFWAPEVIEMEGHYYLYYTAMPDGTPRNEGNRIGLAVAPHPAGPFEDRGVVVPHGTIDGSPYLHRDGTLWLYFTVEHGNSLGLKAGSLGVQRLVTPGEVDPTPRILIDRHTWQEGPCILPAGDRLFLLFSTGSWENETYAITWATGDAPDGPFQESDQYLLRSTETMKGPGHCNVFPGPAGDPWLVYHAWDPAHTARYPRIRPLKGIFPPVA